MTSMEGRGGRGGRDTQSDRFGNFPHTIQRYTSRPGMSSGHLRYCTYGVVGLDHNGWRPTDWVSRHPSDP